MKCDNCGKFIRINTPSILVTPDSELSNEEFEVLCEACKPKEHPMFTVTMYGNVLEATKAKAEYYEKALLRANDMIDELRRTK